MLEPRLERLKKILKGKGFTIVKRRPWLKYLSLLFFLGLVGGTYYYIFHYTKDLTDDLGRPINLEKLAKSDFKKASYVYGDNDGPIGVFFEELRDVARISEIPEMLKYGFIAAEDKRFNRDRPKHLVIDYVCDAVYIGVDPCAIARAGLGIVMRAKNLSGASGIRQQFVRLWYAEEIGAFKNRDHTLDRKIQEARMAIQIGKRYSQDEILEGFLNMIYFGHGVNGINAAAQRYFGKDIRQDGLSLREVAILVSLNKSPAHYCPIFHSQKGDPKETVRMVKARERYNWVLGRMLEDGYISQKDFDKTSFKEDESFELEVAKLRPIKNPTFGYSNRIVKEMLLTSGFREEELSQRRGLRIYTTIDPEIQKIASEEFEKHLTMINQEKGPGNKINGAFVIIEVNTGDIKALSGGNNFNETQYNRVMAPRSPGSGFKPFVYATAMEDFGKGFYDKVCNCPYVGRGAKPGELWIPQNFREKNPQPTGYIDLARGIIWSLNLETINLASSISMSAVVRRTNLMGVHGDLGLVRDSRGDIWFRRPGYKISNGLVVGLPTAIGASEVNLIEIANAYAVFARGGTYLRPNLIRIISDSYGNLVYQAKPSYQERVLSQETSDNMVALMRAVTKIGTAKISMRDIEQQVAVKTGTSDGPRDLGMYGFTPEYVLVIRIGHDNYSVIELPEYIKKVSGDPEMQISGGWVVGPLFRKIIDRIYADRQKVQFSEGVESKLIELLNHYQ